MLEELTDVGQQSVDVPQGFPHCRSGVLSVVGGSRRAVGGLHRNTSISVTPCLVSRDACTHTSSDTHLLGISLQPCHGLQVLVQAPRSSRRLCPKFLRFLPQGGGVLQQSRVGQQRSRGSLEDKTASAPELTSGGVWWTCWWLLVTSRLSTRFSSWLTVPRASS